METKYLARMPFRLDLVMGGVSDLDFWKDREGECLSLSCDFNKNAIQVEGYLLEEPCCIFEGFNAKTLIMDNMEIINGIVNISKVSYEIRMGVAALITAFKILKNQGVLYRKGVVLKNHSLRQKGMGGSSSLAATIIILISKLVGNIDIGFSDLIDAVIRAESLCGSNGGWEDVAGAYYSGLNYVRYRPWENKKLFVERIDYGSLECLKENLLLVDSGISASTEEVLLAARKQFDTYKEIVIASTNNIRSECDKVINALRVGNIQAIGESLIRQRQNWGVITSGVSICVEISRVMADISKDIYGFREAGAGGGGTVLIICREKKKKNVMITLQKNGFRILPWSMSSYGLELS